MACTITRYDCPADSNIINKFGMKANAQVERNHNFVSIFPWRAQCSRLDRHYVATAPNGIICGWLACNASTRYGYKHIYIEEISTRRIKDEFFGGVGTRLHAALVADAIKEDMDFIYLSPLNEDVAQIYAHWGYIRPRSDIKQQFYILKRMPPGRLLDKYTPISPRALLVRSHALAMLAPKDDDLVKLIDKKRGKILEQPNLLEELSIALDSIVDAETYEEDEGVDEDERMPLDDKRELIREVLMKVAGGKRRKTRKQRR